MTVAVTVYLYVVVPKGFFPAAGHRDVLAARWWLIRISRFQAMREKLYPNG